MKGNPAMPGGPSKSKPTRFNTLWRFDRVGFFVSTAWNTATRTGGALPEEES